MILIQKFMIIFPLCPYTKTVTGFYSPQFKISCAGHSSIIKYHVRCVCGGMEIVCVCVEKKERWNVDKKSYFLSFWFHESMLEHK